MKHKTFIAALGIGMIFATGSVWSQTATIKFGSIDSPAGNFVRNGLKPWIKAVTEDAGGTLKIKEFWGGQLARSPRKQYEAMINGLQDATNVLPYYTLKLFPDFSMFQLPYLFRSAEEASVAEWRMHEKGLLRGLDKMYVAAIFSNGNSAVHFTKRIKTVNDFKGMKIRVSGPGGSAIIKALGGSPVGMSITQVATSLQQGVLDGTLGGWSALDHFKITPLIKTHYDEPLGVFTILTGIKKTVYNRLPNKAKRAIDKHSGLTMSRKFGKLFGAEVDRIRKRALADPDRTIISYSEAELKTRAKIFKPFHDRWIENTPDGAKKYKALQGILAKFRKGR